MTRFFNIIKQNDPANFSFLCYKSCCCCAFVANIFYGFGGLIWASAASVGIFFLINIKGSTKDEVFAFFSYIATSIAFVYFMDNFRNLGLYLFIPTFFWLFFISFCSCFNKNLSLALIQTTFGGFFLLIAIKYESDKTAVMIGFLIGGLISTFLRVVSFTSHGKFTKKAFSAILDDLINLNVNLFDNKFSKFQQKSLLHISKLKELFSLKSVQFKDQNLIKNHSRALFYLYKCEEILHLLSIIRASYKQVKDDKIIQELQDEISLNLKNLKLLFLDKDIKVKNDVFLKLKEENKEVISSLEILYHTFNLFILGGERKISLEIKQKNSILSQIKKSFDFTNLTFRYSVKFAFAVSLGVFMALYFNVDHGFWIALGVMTVMRFSVDDIKNATKDTIIATIIGMVIGVGLLLLFGVSLMFYVIGFIMLFLVFYIKPFSFFFWMINFIILLTMYFALVSADYEGLMLLRFEDMAVGFLISIIISSIFWRHRLKDEIRPIIDKILINFSNLLYTIINKNLDNFTNNQSLLLLNLKDYKNSIKTTKSKIFDDILCEFEHIDVMILNLKTYLQKHDFDDEFVNNDLLAIKSRFDMLKSLNDYLPSYFFSDFMNDDKKLLTMMNKITNYQENLYGYIDDAKNTKIW